MTTSKHIGSKSGTPSGKMVNEAQALSMLGEQRFFSADRVVGAWNKLINERRTEHSIAPIKLADSLPIRYTEETLKTVAKEHGWSLIYEPGIGLRDNHAILGTDPTHQPCHRKDNEW